MKGQVDNPTVITGPVNTPLSITDRKTRQKINKKIHLNSTTNPLVLADPYRPPPHNHDALS